MPTTSVRTIFHLSDDKKIVINSVTSTNNSSFCDIDNLIYSSSGKYIPFFTQEHNINILDGSLDVLENMDGFSYFSSNLSDDNCESNDVIIFDLYDTYNLDGVTFNFGVDTFLGTIELSYLNNNTVLNTYTLQPTTFKYLFNNGVDNCNKITVKFTKTKFPRMFNRLQKFYLGLSLEFEGSDIITCNVKEFVHPLSIEVNPTTCEIVIYSENNEFDLLNPNGYFFYLKRNQYVEVFAIYNGVEYEFGKYNLDTWESLNSKETKFNMTSNLDKLNNITYYDGWYCDSAYGNETTYSILDDIMMTSNLEYEINSSLNSSKLMGIIPLDSYKNVIQLVSFCSCCAIDDTRDGKTKFYKIQNSEEPKILSNDEIFDNVKVTKNEQQTTLLLNYFSYDPGNFEFHNVGNFYLKSGESKRIYFDKPVTHIQCIKPNGVKDEVTSESLYYCDFYAEYTGEYQFEATYYEISTTYYEEEIISSENRKEIKIDNARLIYSTNGNNTAGGGSGEPIPGNDTDFINAIKNYYSSAKFIVEFEFVNDGTIKTGEIARVETDYGEYIQGYIIEQNIDLSGGMISKAKLVGKVFGN